MESRLFYWSSGIFKGYVIEVRQPTNYVYL